MIDEELNKRYGLKIQEIILNKLNEYPIITSKDIRTQIEAQEKINLIERSHEFGLLCQHHFDKMLYAKSMQNTKTHPQENKREKMPLDNGLVIKDNIKADEPEVKEVVYRLSKKLKALLDVAKCTQKELLATFTKYIKERELLDNGIIKCNDELKQILRADEIEIGQVSKCLLPHMKLYTKE